MVSSIFSNTFLDFIFSFLQDVPGDNNLNLYSTPSPGVSIYYAILFRTFIKHTSYAIEMVGKPLKSSGFVWTLFSSVSQVGKPFILRIGRTEKLIIVTLQESQLLTSTVLVVKFRSHIKLVVTMANSEFRFSTTVNAKTIAGVK